MTDKQIIIDGVDVSGCEWYSSTYFKPCDGCKNTPNCYYKQLKRDEQRIVELNKTIKAKEQECEELKKDLHQNFEEKDKLHLIIDRLLEASGYDTNTASAEDFEDVYENMRYEKQQLDQLKAEKESLKESLKTFSSTLDWALKSQVGLYKRQIDSSVPDDWEYEEVLVLVEQYIEKLKQTLAEIKEICNSVENIENINSLYDAKLSGMFLQANKILQKISECEVENDNK